MSSTLSIDFANITAHERYKILCGAVVPRPIAWVTTIDAECLVNAAPFSFFNVFSEDPALVVLGLQHRADGSPKDTTRNIHRNGEFVVNLADEALGEAMNDCAIDFPAKVSETDSLGLRCMASDKVAPPRLEAAPFAFECRREVSLAFGPGRELLVGEVLTVHAREGLLDPDTLRVDFDRYHPIGRLFGDLYSRQHDIYAMPRETFTQFKKRNG